MFRQMPFIMIIIIIACIIIDFFAPLIIKQFLYSISMTIKGIIVMLLPIIISLLLFKTMVGLARKATKMVVLLLVVVCSSSLTATFLSRFLGEAIYGFSFSMLKPSETEGLTSLWKINFPSLISNDQAILCGILFGLILAKFKPHFAHKAAAISDKLVNAVLGNFIYIIPFFISGFIIKMQYEGVIASIIGHYFSVFLVVICGQYLYITLIYWLLSGFSKNKLLADLKNMIPAVISGFSTMSSAASMPLTIKAAESISKNKSLAKAIVPVTSNIHLIGDCFAIPIFAYAVIKSFGIEEPNISNYLIFSIYFVLAKFSVAAVPGGGILVMIPILEKYLGFNSDMISMITALYILFDPIITAANVLGNGALVKFIDKVTSFGNMSDDGMQPERTLT
ncbi:MAG: dicarboxylate/amino acid:cation symporter [Rickettsiales bacterium]|nr:dicarboxylate/amino acid:cation symporter [Rickettsiales bacterium]